MFWVYLWAGTATALAVFWFIAWMLAMADYQTGDLPDAVPSLTAYERSAHQEAKRLKAKVAQLETDKAEMADALASRDREEKRLTELVWQKEKKLRDIRRLVAADAEMETCGRAG